MSNVTYGPLVLFEMKMTSIQSGGTFVFCSVHIIYTGSHHHLLSSSLTFYLKFMRFSFRHFGWGLSWMIWIFWWLQACYLIKICQDWKILSDEMSVKIFQSQQFSLRLHGLVPGNTCTVRGLLNNWSHKSTWNIRIDSLMDG